ncbi:(2Fe-2S)-binding protein [Mycobacterium yunnanensis]|uniref:(2Fe-2S)-binding protein n=1 Tax=Mycobacterium yunnanensis TaxID=368477 RepID=A0A9X2Z0V1_9MYCO|nr:(2Fe-2S)-binding protein [Mycobacterium yunnanensis]MCV7421683.1 (2Fe-2S)-binding protein [Mycobacterium yunnanensis]
MNGTSAPYDGAAMLAATAALGGYFALPTIDDGEDLATLLTADAVLGFVERTHAAIAASTGGDRRQLPLRVAASSFQLDLAARLLSPAVGAATLHGAVPVLGPTSVRWASTEHHAPRLGTSTLDWLSAPTPSRAAKSISNTLLTNVFGPLAETLRATTGLSTQISWGNVISATNGAVTVMAASRPDLAPAGRELVRALLGTGPLAGSGHVVDGRFVRRSCCLFYQAPGAGLCGDCVLDATQLQRTRR